MSDQNPHLLIPVHGMALVEGARMKVTALRCHRPELANNPEVQLIGHSHANPELQMIGYTIAEVCPALQDFAQKGRGGQLKQGPECEPCSDGRNISCHWAKQFNIKGGKSGR